jgi:hypothetical protein
MAVDLFYQVNNSFLIFSFAVFGFIVALVSTILYSALFPCGFVLFENDTTGIYLGTITAAIGIVIAFIVTNEWQSYRDLQNLMTREANFIYNMYYTALYLEDSELITSIIKEYLCAIINIEFPQMEQGIIPPDDAKVVQRLVDSIYAYKPDTNKSNQLPLYNSLLSLLGEALQARATRLESVNSGLADELWWVLIAGYFIIVFMSLLLSGSFQSRLLCTTAASVTYAILLFLAVALDSPFKGDFGLDPLPYIYVTEIIGIPCPNPNVLI